MDGKWEKRDPTEICEIVSLEEAISEEQKRTGISLQRVIPVSRK